MNFSILLALLLCLSTPSWAQTTGGTASPDAAPGKPELPSGPMLNAPADFSQWEVDYTYPEDQEKKTKPAPKSTNTPLSKVVTTKTGRIVHEFSVDTSSHARDVWFNGTTQYSHDGNDPKWYQADNLTVRGQLTDQSYDPLPANGYRHLDWINEANFVGFITYARGRCLVFVLGGAQKLGAKGGEPLEKRLESADLVAYVDAETRLPVAVRSRNEVRTYRFDPPPTQMQTLPADLSDQIRKGQEARTRLYQPPARPY